MFIILQFINTINMAEKVAEYEMILEHILKDTTCNVILITVDYYYNSFPITLLKVRLHKRDETYRSCYNSYRNSIP